MDHLLVHTSVTFFRYDSRVKAMELDERPTEQYSDIGGLDKQIEEVGCYIACPMWSVPSHVTPCGLFLLSWLRLLCCQ